MSLYISSVVVVLEPKFCASKSTPSLTSLVISLDVSVGMTSFRAIEFVYKSPLVRSHLRDNHILSLIFKYSKL